jgi:hypothetical protein
MHVTAVIAIVNAEAVTLKWLKSIKMLSIGKTAKEL